MVRIFAFFIGIFFAGMMAYSFVRGGVNFITNPPAETAEHAFHLHPKKFALSGDAPFEKFDQAQLQRGFQVYKEVCSSCHSMKLLSFRDLEGIGYSEGQIKTIAKEWAVETPSINPETGEAATRKSLPSDKFPSPYANDTAARAGNNNALPPDLTLMTKARHNGTNYVYSLLTGYKATQPAELLKKFPDSQTGKGLYYNPYFANLNIAMAPPLTAEGQVTYAEGNPKPTVDQMAQDVSAFLTWTAEPKMENRHSGGIATMLFLLIFLGLCWGAYKSVWADKKS
jgi:ubiquinol-cytochrome c reductase cytochrome c1 subunit